MGKWKSILIKFSGNPIEVCQKISLFSNWNNANFDQLLLFGERYKFLLLQLPQKPGKSGITVLALQSIYHETDQDQNIFAITRQEEELHLDPNPIGNENDFDPEHRWWNQFTNYYLLVKELK